MRMTKSIKMRLLGVASTLAMGVVLVGCNTQNTETTTAQEPGAPDASSNLSGMIRIDGSSTVFPVTEAVAEEFGKANPGVRVTVGLSGTGGGFKKFGAGETAISNASRPIKDTEAATAKEIGVDFVELPISYDGLSVMVHPSNTWAQCLTMDELKKIWDTGSKVNNWNQVREGFPDKPLKLYAPGTDSGTFDYFTEVVNGEGGRSRADFTASEDDNVLVQGISQDEGSLGYFGFAYYEENKDKLKLVEIDGGAGCVLPSTETINTNTYAPLSRPMYIYVSSKHMERPEVRAFVNFYLDNAPQLVPQVGYVPLPSNVYEGAKARFAANTLGSVYASGEPHTTPLAKLFPATP